MIHAYNKVYIFMSYVLPNICLYYKLETLFFGKYVYIISVITCVLFFFQLIEFLTILLGYKFSFKTT